MLIETKKVDLKQGSPEWLEWRRGKITSTASTKIMGLSPYGTPRDFFFEFSGFEEEEDSSKDFIFARGHAVEMELRELIADELGVMLPGSCFESLDGKIGASIDGYLEGKAIAEMKYMGKAKFDAIACGGIDEMPADHYAQVQKNMAMSNTPICYYAVMSSKNDSLVLEIPFNEEYAAQIIKADYQFLKDHQEGKIPPLTDADTLFVQDLDITDAALKYEKVKKNISALSEELKDLEIIIKEAATHKKVRVGNLSITEATRQGAVNWKKVPEIAMLSDDYLEQYRGKSTTYKTIRLKKD